MPHMDRQSIGDYHIVSEPGRGAMGTVYQAFDAAIGRPIAIKVIRLSPDMTADEAAQLRRRLIREASAAGKLWHPNLVTVYRLGEEALFRAASEGKVDAVNPRKNAVDDRGRSALARATEEKSTAVIELLKR